MFSLLMTKIDVFATVHRLNWISIPRYRKDLFDIFASFM